MKKISVIAMLIVCWSCGRFSNQQQPTIKQTRLVCLAKQYTEIMFAIGADSNLVGIDVSSTYPEEAKKIPTVGYHRALSAEGIMSTSPTMIIHDNNIGPEQVVAQLEQMKIPMKTFDTKAEDFSSTKSLMREMGAYFQKTAKAEALCKQLDTDVLELENSLIPIRDSLKVLVVHYGQASNVYLIMTSKSTAAKMIHWAGAKMAVTGEKGMRQLSAEVVAEADPDVILLTDFGYDQLGTADKILQLPGLATTRAAKNKRVYRIEEHDLVYLGPRTAKNVLALHKLIYGNK